MHGTAVTTMDTWGVPPSTIEDPIGSHGASLGAKLGTITAAPGTAPMVSTEAVFQKAIPVVGAKSNGGETCRPIESSGGAAGGGERQASGGFAMESGAGVTECLVVSGALDRTLCVFRAQFGQGLCLLRRLNVACSPRGLPGALIIGVPVEGANGDNEGTQLEVGG